MVSAWVRPYLSQESIGDIKVAIDRFESRCAAELVVVLAPASGGYHHVRWLIFLVFCMLDVPLALHEKVWPTESWGLRHDLLSWGVGIGLLALQWWVSGLLSRISWMKRWLTDDRDTHKAVYRRAECEFFESGMDHTSAKNGILIFISAVEHYVVVLADEHVASVCPPDTWTKLAKAITVGIRQRRLAGALQESIEALGGELSGELPLTGARSNELSNHVVIRDTP